MNHPLPPEPADHPMAPGERLPKSERKDFSPEALAEIAAIAAKYPDKLAATFLRSTSPNGTSASSAWTP